MHLTDRVWFRIVNDLLHDVAAGVLPGSVLALWLVRSGAPAGLDPAALSEMVRTWSWLVLVLFLAAVVIVITGGIRTLYWSATVRPDDQASRGRSALIKHALFVAVFVYAAVVGFGLIQG